jgi:dihydrofolate synthase / folylpolyglutamate synthase
VTYAEALEFLQSRIRFGIRPGTERVAAMMEALNRPQDTYPVLHVAGTNAKYSVVAIATSILDALGITVGTFISPDLGNVRERIGFALEPIDEQGFAGVVDYLKPYIELVEGRLGEELTYFELLTAIAYEAFFDRPVHAAVVEAGLGGEYDATNVADAQVGVLTNVTLDHIRQFGGDLAKAAWEKAGIAKEGSVLITGVEQDDLFKVIKTRALEKGAAEVLRAGFEVDLVSRQQGVGGQLLTIRTKNTTYDDVAFALLGDHQAQNALLAVSAVEAFVGEPVDKDVLEHGLTTVRTPGRMEILRRHPLVICDGGHNPASAKAVRAAVEESFSYERLIFVVGMVREKLIEEVLAVWTPAIDQFVVTAPVTERAADPDEIRDILRTLGVDEGDIDVVGSVPAAVDHALSLAGEDDLVMIFGSFYTASEARDFLLSQGSLAQS